jgi:hypothetical protein
MRLFAIALLLLFPYRFEQSRPSAPPTKSAIQKRDAGKKSNAAKEGDADKSLPTVSTGSTDKAEPTTKYKEDNTYKPAQDTLYRAYLWATIAGVAGGFIGIGVLIWQNIITRTAANAAKQSADALTNIERPWLLMTDADRTTEPTKNPESGVVTELLAVWWKFKNFGKTPAFIDSIAGSLIVVENLEDMAEIPDYSRPYAYSSDPVIAPNQRSATITFVIESTPNVHPDRFSDLVHGKAFLVLYGVIRYFDAFDDGKTKPHESRFCYFYNFTRRGGDGFIFTCGSSGYNKYT